MDPVIRLRKFKLGLWGCLFSLLFALPLLGQTRMPRIYQIGVIPLRWEGSPAPVGQGQEISADLDAQFYKTIEKSQRFRLVDHELVRGEWSTAEGRKALVDDYELDAFVSLAVISQGDTLRMVARLLSPDLQPYFTETEAVSFARLVDSGKDDRRDLLRNLIFRLFNRLPIDVSITSVQGTYVSLSGGESQGIRLGDEFDIVRPFVQRLHPADQSWLSFTANKQGRIKIVDVRKQTAVASIVAQSFDGAVAVTDGLKIPEIEGRRHFLSISAREEFRASQPDKVVMTAPDRPTIKAGNRQAPASMEPAPPKAAAAQADSADEARDDVEKAESEEAGSDTPAQAEVSTPSPSYRELVRASDEVPAVVGNLGLHFWDISGASKAKSGFSPLIFNYLAMQKQYALVEGWDFDGLARLGFGSTSDGSYLLLGAGMRALQRMPLELDGFSQSVRYGGELIFETVSVSGESYGGADLLTLTGFAGLEGLQYVFDQRLLWRGDLFLSPFAFGQAGVGGSKKSVGGYMGYGIRSEAILTDSSSDLEWGGGLEIAMASFKAGSTIKKNDNKLYLLARWKF